MNSQVKNKSYNDLQTKSELRQWSKALLFSRVEFDHTYLEFYLEKFSQPGQVWGGFQSLNPEPNVNWEKLGAKFQITWAFPKLLGDSMDFYQAEEFSLNTEFHVLEPTDGKLISKTEFNGLMIPGLLFDNRGYRLGRGKGYYDKYLVDFKGIKVGVCHKEQFLLRPLPIEKWDQMMNSVITNEYIFYPENIKQK